MSAANSCDTEQLFRPCEHTPCFRLQSLYCEPDTKQTLHRVGASGVIMAHKSESSKTRSGATITTVGGSNVQLRTVKAAHIQAVLAAEIIGVQNGVRVEVHLGTNKTRCGTRRNGVHYSIGDIHYVGVHHNFYTAATGFNSRGLGILAHEMTHVDQYSSGRLKIGAREFRYGTWQATYVFSGEWNGTQGPRSYVTASIHRPRSPTYSTYRNFPWEQEAFETQDKIGRAIALNVEGRATLEAPQQVPTTTAGKYDCPHCARKYQSYAGRYNHLRKNQCPNQPPVNWMEK